MGIPRIRGYINGNISWVLACPIHSVIPSDINYMSMLPWNPGGVHIVLSFRPIQRVFQPSALMILVVHVTKWTLQRTAMQIHFQHWLCYPTAYELLHFASIHGHSSAIFWWFEDVRSISTPIFRGGSPHFLVVSRMIVFLYDAPSSTSISFLRGLISHKRAFGGFDLKGIWAWVIVAQENGFTIYGCPEMGVPQNRCFIIVEHPPKVDDLRVPPFQESSIRYKACTVSYFKSTVSASPVSWCEETMQIEQPLIQIIIAHPKHDHWKTYETMYMNHH